MSKSKLTGFQNGRHDLVRGVDFIGVTCAFVCHDGRGRVLMQKRSKNCRDEQGRWDNGGGAHEFGTNLEDTVRREIAEEYGAKATSIRYIETYDAHRTNLEGQKTHWVVILFAAQIDPKKALNNEPYKIDEIGWFKHDDLPTPLHSQSGHNIEQLHKLGTI